MTMYEAIYESLQEQVNEGMLTFEDAEILNEMAYEKYCEEVTESAEDDAVSYEEYLEAMEDALFGESKRLEREIDKAEKDYDMYRAKSRAKQERLNALIDGENDPKVRDLLIKKRHDNRNELNNREEIEKKRGLIYNPNALRFSRRVTNYISKTSRKPDFLLDSAKTAKKELVKKYDMKPYKEKEPGKYLKIQNALKQN